MKTENLSNSCRKTEHVLYAFIIHLLIGLFAVLAVYLLLLAGFSTTAIDVKNEHSFLIKDSMILNMALSAGIIVIVFLMLVKCGRFRQFVNRVNEDAAYYKKCRRIALIALGFICMFVLIALQAGPRSDQAYISAAAVRLMNRDYMDFQRGEYMELYPHQMGIVFFLYGLANIVGANNYLAFQFLNVLALLLVYWNFAVLSDMTGHRNIVGLMIVWCGFLFFPAILYTTFIYGNLLGLAMSLCAVRHFYRRFCGKTVVDTTQSGSGSGDGIREKMLRAAELLLALAEMYGAIAFKSNYQIFALGTAVLLFMMTLREKRCVRRWVRAGICLFGIIVILLYGSRVINKCANQLFGVDLSGGVSHWAWVAMGLQENEYKYDGWYNGYTLDTYYTANSSAERQDPIVKEYIEERVQKFIANPGEAIRFFAGKNASQWNNPTFQAFYCVRDMSNNVPRSRMINAILSTDGERAAGELLNLFQFMVLLGSVVYVFIGIRKKTDTNDDKTDLIAVFYMVTVIGGFVFHSFWEGKSQYIFTYFMLFFPLGMYGGETVVDAFLSRKAVTPTSDYACKQRAHVEIWQVLNRYVKSGIFRLFAALIVLSGGIFVLGRAGNAFCQDVFLRQEDTADYEEFLNEYRYVSLPDTAYIENVGGKEVHFVSSKYDNSYCLSTSDGQILTISDLIDGCAAASFEGKNIFVADDAYYIQKSEKEGEYYIIYVYGRGVQYLLTRGDEGELYFTSRSGEDNQLWEIEFSNGD